MHDGAVARDIPALVRSLCDQQPMGERTAAAERLVALLQTAEEAHGAPALRACAEDIVRADGVLPLLQMMQGVERHPDTLAPLSGAAAPACNTKDALAMADSALLCCSQLCAAAGSALRASGWKLVPAPEDGRPAYLHTATSVVRNSPPDIGWPEGAGPSSTTTILGCFHAPFQTQMIHCAC